MEGPNIKSGQNCFVLKMTQYQLYNVGDVNWGHLDQFWPRGVPWEACLSENGHLLRLLGGKIGVKHSQTTQKRFQTQPGTHWGWCEHFYN